MKYQLYNGVIKHEYFIQIMLDINIPIQIYIIHIKFQMQARIIIIYIYQSYKIKQFQINYKSCWWRKRSSYK